MRGKKTLSEFLINSAILLSCLLLIITSGCKKEPEEQVIELEEVSAFDVPKELFHYFANGQSASCTSQPDPNVTIYPQFACDKPLFGSIYLPRGIYLDSNSRLYSFAIDSSGREGLRYDTLYFDFNRDSDLTNDGPIMTQNNPPEKAILNSSRFEQEVCFNCFGLPLAFGNEGMRSLEVMPRFFINESGDSYLQFVTTRAFRGKVEIAGQRYDVWLGHNRYISGWFDSPSTALHLIPDRLRQSL